MFEDLEVANKEYEDLKAKYDELVIAKNGADEKIKSYSMVENVMVIIYFQVS